jgi:hypothetical protein
MKRSTLILLLIAALLGVGVYYLEIKKGSSTPAAKTDTSKALFSFASGDIASITIARLGQSVTIENQSGKWAITQPVTAPADESTVNALTGSIASSRVSRTLSASADDVKSYGLEQPAVTVDIKLKSGEQHRILLGNKDFSERSVYGRVDDAPGVDLLPVAMLTDADKSIDDLRDKSVFSASQYEIISISLSNEQGQVTLSKEGSDWKIKSPVNADADESKVSSTLGRITSAKSKEFVKDPKSDLATYGLDKPKIVVTARLAGGGEQTLTIGSKVDDLYYAKNSAQQQIFKVEPDLYDDLNVKLADLRDKRIVKIEKADLSSVVIKNANLKMSAEKDKDGKWVVSDAGDSKGKEFKIDKILDPLSTNKATEILDKPSSSVSGKLSSPKVEIHLTDKAGKTTVVNVSAADGDSVYVNIQGRPGVYKVAKQLLDDLNFKTTDVVG